jgi:hypothetical protein
MWLWRWRARRQARPIVEEAKADAERIERGVEEWQRWWRHTGERELRCILMTAWDPIGVGDAPEAWNEYDSYIAGVGSRLQEMTDPDRAAESAVAEYLDHVERDFMEAWTPERGRANVDLADSLAAWHEWSFLRGGRPLREWVDDD